MVRRRRGLSIEGHLANSRGRDQTAKALVERIMGQNTSESPEQSVWITLDRVHRAPWQSRGDYGAEEIDSLVDSIERDGLLQPPLVRHDPADPNRYQIVFGHRRVEAMRLIAHSKGIRPEEYRVRVQVRECSEVMAMMLTAVENAHRKDLAPYELGQSVAMVHAALMREGLPHTDRDLAPLFSMRSAGALSEYRQIGSNIPKPMLWQAGLIKIEDDQERVDWALIGQLTKGQLLTIAKIKTEEARIAQLRRLAERVRRRCGTAAEKMRIRPAQSSTQSGPRYTVEGLLERGDFAVKLSKPFKSYTLAESQRYLADILPAVHALVRNINQEIPGIATVPAAAPIADEHISARVREDRVPGARESLSNF